VTFTGKRWPSEHFFKRLQPHPLLFVQGSQHGVATELARER
jgi:hypothetical protein